MNSEYMKTGQMQYGQMQSEQMQYGQMQTGQMNKNEEMQLCADFEQIMPIDEFSVLTEENKKKEKDITVTDLYNTEWRYRRYIMMINDWTDRKGTDYSYIKEKVYEYLGEKDNKKRIKQMKYIDGEIMLMINMCRIDEMEF
jgi:hypothetical protein